VKLLSPISTKVKGFQSISKCLFNRKSISRNRTHLQSYSLIQCVVLREIDFLIKIICWWIQNLHLLWSGVTWMQICASLNHRKKMKTERSRMMLQNLQQNYRACYTCSKLLFASPYRIFVIHYGKHYIPRFVWTGGLFQKLSTFTIWPIRRPNRPWPGPRTANIQVVIFLPSATFAMHRVNNCFVYAWRYRI